MATPGKIGNGTPGPTNTSSGRGAGRSGSRGPTADGTKPPIRTDPQPQWDDSPQVDYRRRRRTVVSEAPSRVDPYERQTEPLRVVYGRKRVKGSYRAYRKVQTDGRYLVCYRLCWGPISTVSDVTIDGVTLADLGLANGVDYNLYTNGSPAADPIMTAREPLWATAPHPTDCAHLVVLFKKPTDQIPAVKIENIECTIDGMLVFDPAQDATLTTRYYRSDNPRLAIADFETDDRYGCGFPTSIVYGEPGFLGAVNDCDTDLGGGRKRYTWGLELFETMEADDALEMMRGHAALQWGYDSGYRRWWVDLDRDNCGVTFSNLNAPGNIVAVSPLEYKGTSQMPTRVIVAFTNEAAGWKRDYATDDHPSLAGGGVELVEQTFEYLGIKTYDQAKRIAKWIRATLAIPKSGRIRVSAAGFQVLPGSRITIGHLVEWNLSAPSEWTVLECKPVKGRSSWELLIQPYTNVWDDTNQTQTEYTPPANLTPLTLLPATTSAQLLNVRGGAMGAVGGRSIIAPTARLAIDLSAVATSMTVDVAAFANGDRVVLQKITGTTQQTEYLAVTSASSGTGPYTYSVTRNLDGSGANAWCVNDVIVGTGQTGSSFIDQYNLNGLKSTSEVGPAIAFNIRNSATYNDWSPRALIGNLNGLFGYVADTFGAAFGVPSGAWLKIDPTNGVRIGYNSQTFINIDAGGGASFSGAISAGSVTIGPDGLSIEASGVSDTSAYVFTENGTVRAGVYYAGSNGLALLSGGQTQVNIDADGLVVSPALLGSTAIDVVDGVFKVDGTQVVGPQGAAIADVASPNATDLASAITLVNELKTKLNTLLARNRTHGLIAT